MYDRAGRDNEAKRCQNIGSSLMDGRIKTEVHASHLVRNPGQYFHWADMLTGFLFPMSSCVLPTQYHRPAYTACV